MPAANETIFEQFLAPIFNTFLLDREALRREKESIDWSAMCDRLQNPDVAYPDYYKTQAFHGIDGGYLTPGAAITYDPITQYVLPPNEVWVRQGLIERIRCFPTRILDLGCGTGSTTVMLKQAFPNAEVIGLDLSPYMLIMAERKAIATQTSIQVTHGNAEATGFADQSFDLVTASLLFHETPPVVTQNILREAARLLTAGGEMLVLDGNQATLRQNQWTMTIFEEPYIQDYAEGNIDAWMGAAGLDNIRTHDHWWIHQVTRGVKPLPDGSTPDSTEAKNEFIPPVMMPA